MITREDEHRFLTDLQRFQDGYHDDDLLTWFSNRPMLLRVCRFCSRRASPDAYKDTSSSWSTEIAAQNR